MNDILEQINDIIVKSEKETSSGKEKQNKSVKPDSKESKKNSSPAFVNEAFEELEDGKRTHGEHLELTERDYAKVVPLYTPDNAVVKIFMVHGSEKSALALASFARGFQSQVLKYSAASQTHNLVMLRKYFRVYRPGKRSIFKK